MWINNTDPGQPAHTGNPADQMKRVYDVNYVTPEDGYLDQLMKPSVADTANRYFLSQTTIEYELP